MDPHFYEWGQNLTHKNPFGIILEKMGACAKAFWKLLKIYRFYLDHYFSVWGPKGLEPDPQFPFVIILEKMGACAKPFWKLLKIYKFYLGPQFSKGFGT